MVRDILSQAAWHVAFPEVFPSESRSCWLISKSQPPNIHVQHPPSGTLKWWIQHYPRLHMILWGFVGIVWRLKDSSCRRKRQVECWCRHWPASNVVQLRGTVLESELHEKVLLPRDERFKWRLAMLHGILDHLDNYKGNAKISRDIRSIPMTK